MESKQTAALIQFVYSFSKGIITDCRITHATPAALYAHTQDRKWESDSEEVFQPFRNKGRYLCVSFYLLHFSRQKC